MVHQPYNRGEATAHNRHSSSHTQRQSHHTDLEKQQLLARLNRIEGQIRGIKGLIEKNTYCDSVLQQISAVQSALNGVAKNLLEEHLKNCVVDRIQDGDMQVVDELLYTIQTMLKKS